MTTLLFRSLSEMGQHAAQAFDQSNIRSVLRHGMMASAYVVKNYARGMLGTYQKGAGPFGDWKTLSPVTQRRREAAGYRPNAPLYVTGELSRSYEVDHKGDSEVGVGSDLPSALAMEIGNPHQNLPARPVLGLAFVRVEKHAFAALVEAIGTIVTTKPATLAPYAARLVARKYERRTVMAD